MIGEGEEWKEKEDLSGMPLVTQRLYTPLKQT